VQAQDFSAPLLGRMIIWAVFFNQLICRMVEIENGGNLDPLLRYKSANRAEYRRRSV